MPRVTGAGKGGDGVGAVVLALEILERLADEGRPMGVTALAASLGTTKSRIWRYLQTLVQRGYVVQVPETERYQLGARMVRFGRAVGEGLDIVSASYGPLRDLRDGLGHSAVLAQVEPEGIRVLTAVPGRSPIEIGVKPGSLLDFHSSAQGKVALAFGAEPLRARVFGRRLERRSPATIIAAEGLRAEVERVRRDGWAMAPNEAVTGLNAVAAPIFDASGALVGTLAIVDSVQFIPESPRAEQVDRTVEAARRVSAALGYLLS